MTIRPWRHSRTPLGLALVAVAVAVLGCSGDDGGEAGTSTTVGGDVTTSTTPATTTTLDQGPFCTGMRALESLDDGVEGEPTLERVLAQNEEMLVLIDEVTVNVPEGAPFSVESLLDDLRAIALAIEGTGGDVDAAYARIAQDQPELNARLADPGVHADAFEYIATRCGTSVP